MLPRRVASQLLLPKSQTTRSCRRLAIKAPSAELSSKTCIRHSSSLPRPVKPQKRRIGLATSLLASLTLITVGGIARPESEGKEEVSFSRDVGERVYEREEVAKHVTEDSAWVILDGEIWDVTNFLGAHPAGADILLANAGKDISTLFNSIHARGTFEKVKTQLTHVGTVAGGAVVSCSTEGHDDSPAAQRRRLLPPVGMVYKIAQFEALAKQVLGEGSRGWDHYNSWSDDGATYLATRDSFSFLRFFPRVNVPVKDIDSTTSYLSGTCAASLPIYISPVGGMGLGHPDAEFNLLRAASSIGIPQMVSSAASKGILEVLEERDSMLSEGKPKADVWWQLYIRTDREQTEKDLMEVKKNGVGAIVITVDVPVLGNREADKITLLKGFEPGTAGDAPKARAAVASTSMFDINMGWEDIAWVKKFAPGVPVLVKGISCVEDVELAKKFGASGVVLSNHGGRQLDYAPPPLATLVRLRVESPHLLTDPKFEVYIDGGVSRGTDILKALCLGAKGVGLGRAFLYAQTCYGAEGAVRACEILSDEVVRGMRLLGVTKISDLKPEMIELMDGLIGKRVK